MINYILNISQMSRIRYFSIAFLFFLLLFLGAAQRGGSRSSSSSKSSSSSHHHHSHHNSHANQNCTIINGTKTCTYTEQSGQLSWTAILIFLAIFVGLIAFGSSAAKKDEERRKTTIEGALKAYQAKIQEWPSTIKEDEKSAMIDAFMKKQYTMVINVRDKAEKFFCRIKVLDLKKENDTRYRIKLSGKDEVGTSKLEGLLVFKGSGMGLKLSKVYDDRTKAEQTGKFDILLYEGAGDPNKIDGQWAFYGFQSSTEYAGNWTLIEI